MRKYILDHSDGLLAPAYVANGFIGFRFGPCSLVTTAPGRLSGYDYHVYESTGKCAPVPTPSIPVYIDGIKTDEKTCRFVKQVYDFSCGELETFYDIHINGKKARLVHTLFCSRSAPTLLVYHLEVTAETEMEFAICEQLSANGKPMSVLEYNTDYASIDFDMLITGDNGLDRAGVAIMSGSADHTLIRGRASVSKSDCEGHRMVAMRLMENEMGTLNIFTSYVPGCMHSEPQLQALRELKLAEWEGFESIRSKNAALWGKIWESRITLEGDDVMQETLDASFFYLMSSVHRSSPVSIGPYALSNFGFDGHAFWDTESFMFMIPLLVDPESAENLLDYRFRCLEMAKNNAKLNGYLGAQYPWQSAKYGDEVTPTWAGQAAGAGEQHINLDVAMAFVAYCKVTGDDMFIREKAWSVLRNIADWITSRVERTERGYEILHVCGIDEDQDNVRNDSYTNIMCAKVLNAACEIAETLGYKAKKIWKDIADNLFLPIDPELKYMKQHEDSCVSPVMKNDSLMAFFPYGYSHSEEVDYNTMKVYIDHGFEEALRFPMMSNFLGVFPAMIGDRKYSRYIYDYVRNRFFVEPYLASSEYGTANEMLAEGKLPETTFLTARGALLCGVMMGLTCMDFWQGDPDKWFTRDVCLPEGWKRLTLGKILIQGRPAKVTAMNGKKPVVEWLDGKNI